MSILIAFRELWHPPGARGVYGGAVIAQCLSAAQSTVPEPAVENGNAIFFPHSMHCYFVLAGDPTIPILYAVERIRTGRSFLTRTVQARQRGKCIFTTTISFVREGSGGAKTVEHGWDMPKGVREALNDILKADESNADQMVDRAMGVESMGPFISKRLGIYNGKHNCHIIFIIIAHSEASSSDEDPRPHAQRPQSWLQCRGKLSESGGINAHLSAMAYMSDSWFIGTVSRVHKLSRFSQHAESTHPFLKRVAMEEQEENVRKGDVPSNDDLPRNTRPAPQDAKVGMMVSLDHTIYFHRPRDVRADDWMFSEMESPWSGDGRGLVIQRIWNKEGKLVATCVQEVNLS